MLFDQDSCNEFKIPKLASLGEIVDRVLLIDVTPDQESSELQIDHGIQSNINDENTYHMACVLFCTYRTYANPHELLLKFIDRKAKCQSVHYRNIIDIWIKNYPEDFGYIVRGDNSYFWERSSQDDLRSLCSLEEYCSNVTLGSITESISNESINNQLCKHRSGKWPLEMFVPCKCSGTSLAAELRLFSEDGPIEGEEKHVDVVSGSPVSIQDADCRPNRLRQRFIRSGGHPLGRSLLLAMDSRFVAEQLNTMDVENMIHLRPYTLLMGTKSDPSMQKIVRNFNLLSRHVVLSILESHNPLAVTLHWIGICSNLRDLKNFNSLKAIIAGLTNESIHRLRKTIWRRLPKVTIDSFKSLASDVDDMDNQTTLRKTQLEHLYSADMAIVPYLGTFLTDLNFLNAHYSKYEKMIDVGSTGVKMINFEECSKQYELIRIVNLFQKRIIDKFLSPIATYKIHVPSTNRCISIDRDVPKASRVFEDWFLSHYVSSMSDKEW